MLLYVYKYMLYFGIIVLYIVNKLLNNSNRAVIKGRNP